MHLDAVVTGVTLIACCCPSFLQYSGTQFKIFFTNLFLTLTAYIPNELNQQEMLIGNNYRSETDTW